MKYLKKFNESDHKESDHDKEQSINTVKKFLDITGYARGTKHPNVTSLKKKMDELNIDEDLKIDIMSFFLYDGESK